MNNVGRRGCCTSDGGLALRSLLAGAGFKPANAAVSKRHGGERLVKRLPERESGVYQEDERKRTVEDPSLEVKVLSKPGRLGVPGISLAATCLLARRQPVYRRHEPDAGAGTEHGNLLFDDKGKDKWQNHEDEYRCEKQGRSDP